LPASLLIKDNFMKTLTFQEKARLLIEKEVNCNLCLTVDQQLKYYPDLLIDAKNYYPIDEDGKRDDDKGEYPEIFEFWAVSEWLGKKLEKKGEVVFKMLDFIVWGRQTTGQALYMDGIIEEIARNMY